MGNLGLMRKVLLFICAASQPQTGGPTPPSTVIFVENFEGRVYLNISCKYIVQLGNNLIDISIEKHNGFAHFRIFKIYLS